MKPKPIYFKYNRDVVQHQIMNTIIFKQADVRDLGAL